MQLYTGSPRQLFSGDLLRWSHQNIVHLKQNKWEQHLTSQQGANNPDPDAALFQQPRSLKKYYFKKGSFLSPTSQTVVSFSCPSGCCERVHHCCEGGRSACASVLLFLTAKLPEFTRQSAMTLSQKTKQTVYPELQTSFQEYQLF